MVVEGTTACEPLALTAPTVGLMLTEVAFCVVQESVAAEPVVTEVGSATSVHTGAGGVTVTVTVAVQSTEPPGPVAVPV